jgi:hypothetical protein
MRKYHKKAQAAMEFLMTYGWAILVVLTGISALAYFGVLDTSTFIPKRCIFAPGLSCIDYEIEETTGRVKFALKNNLGDTITDVKVTLISCSWEGTGQFANGESFTADLENCNIKGSGRLNEEPIIIYTKTQSGLTFTERGFLSGSVGSGSGKLIFEPYSDPSECPEKLCQTTGIVGVECAYTYLGPYATDSTCISPNYCDGSGNCVECITADDCSNDLGGDPSNWNCNTICEPIALASGDVYSVLNSGVHFDWQGDNSPFVSISPLPWLRFEGTGCINAGTCMQSGNFFTYSWNPDTHAIAIPPGYTNGLFDVVAPLYPTLFMNLCENNEKFYLYINSEACTRSLS